MRYAIIENGVVVNVAEAAEGFPASFDPPLDNWKPCPDECQIGFAYDEDADEFTFDPGDLADRKEAMRTELAQLRWSKEVAGFVWQSPETDAYYFIATDEVSQGKMISERRAAENGLRRAGDVWKCGDPATGLPIAPALTDAEIIAMSTSARARTSDLFNHEGSLLQDIADAEDHDALDAIDLAAGWP